MSAHTAAPPDLHSQRSSTSLSTRGNKSHFRSLIPVYCLKETQAPGSPFGRQPGSQALFLSQPTATRPPSCPTASHQGEGRTQAPSPRLPEPDGAGGNRSAPGLPGPRRTPQAPVPAGCPWLRLCGDDAVAELPPRPRAQPVPTARRERRGRGVATGLRGDARSGSALPKAPLQRSGEAMHRLANRREHRIPARVPVSCLGGSATAAAERQLDWYFPEIVSLELLSANNLSLKLQLKCN